MSENEAIKILEEVKVNNDGMSQYIEGYDEAFDRALEALKKQIPKEPIRDKKHLRFPMCPCCKSVFYQCYIDNYCNKCGQKFR